jgi:hypothetical protein
MRRETRREKSLALPAGFISNIFGDPQKNRQKFSNFCEPIRAAEN